MELRIVDSCPPCWLPVAVKIAPTLPTSVPFPEPTGLIEEVAHLRCHVAETGRGADNDGIIVDQFVDGRDLGRLIALVPRVVGHRIGNQLGNSLNRNEGTRLAGPFRHGIGHRLDMAPGRIIENKHSGHSCLLCLVTFSTSLREATACSPQVSNAWRVNRRSCLFWLFYFERSKKAETDFDPSPPSRC